MDKRSGILLEEEILSLHRFIHRMSIFPGHEHFVFGSTCRQITSDTKGMYYVIIYGIF